MPANAIKPQSLNGLSKSHRKMEEQAKHFTLKNCDPPALELDVYISENHMEKLIVYKEDWPETIANEFWLKFNLDNDKKVLLLNVIKEQVSKVLTCISEEDIETEMYN